MKVEILVFRIDLTVQTILFFGAILCGFLTGVTMGAFGFFTSCSSHFGDMLISKFINSTLRL